MSSTVTTLLKSKGFAIPSALDYSKIFAEIGSKKFSASKCNCGGCSCSTCSCGGSKCISCKGCGRGRGIYPRQSLIW